jgi:hypothetical protein
VLKWRYELDQDLSRDAVNKLIISRLWIQSGIIYWLLAVSAVLLQGNSTNSYIFDNLYCPKTFHRPDHSIRRSIEYQKKNIISKPNIFTETRIQGSFRVWDSSFCNLAKTNRFVLCAVLPSYRNHLHRKSNTGQFVGVVVLVPVISSSRQTTLALAPFFYRA